MSFLPPCQHASHAAEGPALCSSGPKASHEHRGDGTGCGCVLRPSARSAQAQLPRGVTGRVSATVGLTVHGVVFAFILFLISRV